LRCFAAWSRFIRPAFESFALLDRSKLEIHLDIGHGWRQGCSEYLLAWTCLLYASLAGP
jgi:hypothetical protein